ncbi:YfiT family bacillithiol transferase, partial [Paenibacillus sp. PL91]|uniref:YfiT family bacillithiol transferase n=1 Tax=Paenibacillus sp. PL91 TaxID=2729538 RepID=UPI001659B537
MDDFRYPIGKFEQIENPTSEQCNKWIEDISETGKILRLAVENLTIEQLLTQYRPGGWTVQQVIHHLADNDMSAYIRFKKALTEDSPAASSYGEDLWAELSDYRTPIETSLSLLESIHIRFVAILRALHPSDFKKTFTSPTHGVMSLNVAIQRYVW